MAEIGRKIMDIVRHLFWSSRPVSWINTAFPFAAAYLLITQQVDAVFIVATFYFLIPYNLLMYGVNDVFDYESDIKNPRKGSIEGAILPRHLHRVTLQTAFWSNLPFLAYLGIVGSIAASAVLAAVVFMVVAYSIAGLRFKERPLLDSVTSSTHFVGPMVYAMVLVGWQPEYWSFVVAFFLWGMASHAFGAVQDIIPDREAGLHSIATWWGASRTVRAAFVFYILSAAILILEPFPIPLLGICILLYALNVLRYVSVSDADSAITNRAWKRFMWLNMLTGFIVTVLMILALR